jgi:hypothetical protein
MNINIIVFLVILCLLLFLINYRNNEFFYNKKELKFIHITKNAGTYIEDTAKKSNILFGRHHTEYRNNKDNGAPWHHIFPNINKNVKDKYDWFMVVRNPYTRLLSEYYCQWGGIGNKNINHTKKEMNNYLINNIKNREKKKVPRGHYIEQYKYLDGDYNIHIIKYENLIPGLKKLYKKYNLNIVLTYKQINSAKEKNNIQKFTTKDFNNELLNIINNVYSKDFEIFNYNNLI